jgi:hypothetical protein
MDAEHIEYMPLSQIQGAVRNSRQWDIGAIHQSMDRFGFVGAVAINETTGRLVFGHGRITTLRQKKASGEKPPARITEKKGEWYVPVIRGIAFASDQEAEAYLLADNRTTILGTDDPTILTAMLSDLAMSPEGLTGIGYDGDDLDRMMRELNINGASAEPAEPQIDKAAELQKKWQTAEGQIWRAGPHRLACGDCRTLGKDMKATVVLTDPPYNVGKNYGVADDQKNQAEYLTWTQDWFRLAKTLTATSVVLTIGITNLPMWLSDVERTHAIIAWIKTNQMSPQYIGPGGGFNCWEPVLVYGRAKKCIPQDIFDIPIGTQADTGDHPCPKSLKAWTWLLEAFTDRGDSVTDLFIGTGTTLIAAQQTGRIGYGCEIDPRWCAVSLERLANLGLKPELITDG